MAYALLVICFLLPSFVIVEAEHVACYTDERCVEGVPVTATINNCCNYNSEPFGYLAYTIPEQEGCKSCPLALLVGFNQSIIPTREGDGNFTIRVEVVSGTIAAGLTISIEYILQNGTTDDINTTSPSNIIEFTSSKPFGYISFEVNDDDIIELTESYTITLLQASMQVEFVNATSTIVITDNDNAILQVDQMLERSLVEGNFNSSNAESICVTLIEVTSGGLDRDIIVDVTTSDETAIRGRDYVLDDTSLTFSSTSLVMQELCISVNITEDVLTETNETFTVILSPGTQDIFQGGSNVTITIIDDDSATVVINQPLNRSLVEGASGSLTTVTICVTLVNILPGGLVRDVIVDVTASDGTATGGRDYVFDRTSLTFTSISTMNQELCISFNIIGDALTEGNENFTVVFTLATPDIFQGGSIVTIFIIDDDHSLTCREIGGIIIAVVLFLLLFIIVAALLIYRCSKRTSGKKNKPDGNHSWENTPNISRELGIAHFVQENPKTCVTMESLGETLDDSVEPQERGTAREMENVMPETTTIKTTISFGEDAANTAL